MTKTTTTGASSKGRWIVVRATTDRYIRTFKTRTAARTYKKSTTGKFRIWDNVAGSYVR